MCGIGFVLLISVDSCEIFFSERYISEALQDSLYYFEGKSFLK